ncbi:hypothetical protein CEUSTIGMA_g9224.t1 [Chlamydomonas eustigma]|uniref:Pirin N-terminal domain-containing protein n=1 Tax=Chlamydomonas eustigma TaxID=1157962 RepID=A0A250XFI4_9CHLO|nr:hypothetical protein CEUSTIGMA_g9224.t1 [Chlamydomonas eustigma]|eukprot:GAX81796.1 hypothetical protein CEUSTIGMA_g9224.t1 [Chlamydomonas eustigma]
MLQALKNTAASFRQQSKKSDAVNPLVVQEPIDYSSISRRIIQIISEEHAVEGPGIEITRPFPTRSLKYFDPWLLVDAFGPKTFPPGHPLLKRSIHLGQHPHRGFQAITYHVAGDFDHYDSTGRHGRLTAGSVQLMTAGGGIVHGGASAPKKPGEGLYIHGYQIWLALPASERMCPADSMDWHADQTPVVHSPDGKVWARVIASTELVYGATCTKIPTAQPIMMVHFVVQPGGVVKQAVPASFNTMIHVSIGTGRFGPGLSTSAGAEQSVIFEREEVTSSAAGGPSTSFIEFCCPKDAKGPLDVLLLAGQPTQEKIIQYGPFVGGSMDDIYAARNDFQAGLMGGLAPDGSPEPKSVWCRQEPRQPVVVKPEDGRSSNEVAVGGHVNSCWPATAER